MFAPRPESPQTPPAIDAVLDMALAYNAALAMKDISTVYVWTSAGASIELDILPTMKRIMDKKTGIGAFKYFTNAILEAMQKRLIAVKLATSTKELTQVEKDATRAKNIAWHRDRGICTTNVGPQDYAWLKHYEVKHGAVV
jgi:hypothetical protein